jgi:acyl dehydratase
MDNTALWWEDFPTGSVHPYGPMAVTREAVLAYARQWDPQPFHVDDAAAEASLFGKLSASGWHTCAMTMRMLCDALLLRSSSLGSPGLDSVKWLHPVYPGDTLSGTLTVLDARPMNSKPGLGLVKCLYETRNQQGQGVLRMEGFGMFRQRPA